MALRTIGTGENAYEEKSKHLTGIPRSLVRDVRSYVERRRLAGGKVTHGAVYERAVSEFMAGWRRGERPVIESQTKGERAGPVQFWGRREVVEDFEAFCVEIGKDLSPVFIAALTRFVARAGRVPGGEGEE